MAILRFGPTVADVRGSLDALTYSRNTGAHYLASRSFHARAITANQAAARVTLAAAAAAWRDLDSAQRTAWDVLAATPPEIDYDPWAVQKYLTGFAWFVRIHTRQNSTSETLPTDPPTDAQPTPPTITAATIAPYGSANASSYITFNRTQTSIITNGGFEPPYVSGVADGWAVRGFPNSVGEEETAAPYAGASSQRVYCLDWAGYPGIQQINAHVFTARTYTYTIAVKTESNRLSYFKIDHPVGSHTYILSNLTPAAWTLYTGQFTPTGTGASIIQAINTPAQAATWLLDSLAVFPPEFLILSAAINPSPGRQTPDHSYRLLHAGYSTTPTTISIGDALANLFGAYPAGWTVFLKLERQTISGLRSTPALFTTTTG